MVLVRRLQYRRSFNAAASAAAPGAEYIHQALDSNILIIKGAVMY